MIRILKNLLLILLFIKVEASNQDISDKVEYIQRTLLQHKNMLDQASGREIIVLMGNTGSGKSTLASLLTDIPLRIDSSGRVVQNTGVFNIGSGRRSITKYPTYIEIDGEMVWDCPGFNDTEGAVDDVLAAAMIRDLLTKAASVKAIFVTSVAEIEAARGPLFNRLLRTIGMFEKQFFESSLMVINKVESEIIEAPNWLQSVFENSRDELEKLSQSCKEIIPLRKTRATHTVDVLFGDRDRLRQAIASIEGRVVSSVDMSLAFGEEASDVLVSFFTLLAKKTLTDYRQSIYEDALGIRPLTSSNVSAVYDLGWSVLWTFVRRRGDYQLLSPFAEKQVEVTSNEFRETFLREHVRYVQELQMKEQEETIRKKEEEIKRLNDARLANERRANEETIKAEGLMRERAAAQEKERVAIAEAEKIKEFSLKSEREKAEALRRVNEAVAEKARLDQAIAANQRAIQNAEQERQRLTAQNTAAQNAIQQQAQQFQREREAQDLRNQQALQALRNQMDALTGRLGQMAQLQAQLDQLRGQVTQVTPHINATNQRITERNNRINSGGGRHHHHGHRREPWPLIPNPW